MALEAMLAPTSGQSNAVRVRVQVQVQVQVMSTVKDCKAKQHECLGANLLTKQVG